MIRGKTDTLLTKLKMFLHVSIDMKPFSPHEYECETSDPDPILFNKFYQRSKMNKFTELTDFLILVTSSHIPTWWQ